MEMMFCKEHETCIMDDDMQQMYRKFREMDSLIIATPVMTMGIPGKLKSFMDRFQVFFMAKYMRKKPLVAADKKARRRSLVHLYLRHEYSGSIRWCETDPPGILRYHRLPVCR